MMVDRIYLIGFMGTGKSTVGKGLAAQLGFTFLDTDQIIETRAGMTIPMIFETYGEPYFWDLESEILTEMERNTQKAVIATGGGIVLREFNRKLLCGPAEGRLVVELTADVSTLVSRLMQDRTRPLLQGDELEQRIFRLQQEHTGLYDFADLTIATDSLSTEEIVNQIIHTLVRR